jgi:hypothetical protein
MQSTLHVYEVRPRRDKRGVDLISDALPFGRLWYGDTNAVANAIGYAEHYSRSHGAVIYVYDESGNMIETHEQRQLLLHELSNIRCPLGTLKRFQPTGFSSYWVSFDFCLLV